MINIEAIYAANLREKQVQTRKKYTEYKGWFSASSAGSCFKKQLLRRANMSEPPMDDRVMRLLRLGTIVHTDIQTAITDSEEMSNIKYQIMMEKRIEIPELNIVGHVDIAIIDKDNGDLKVMDIKTCASYKWRMKFGRKPDKKGNPGYNMQLATYTEAFKRRDDTYGRIDMSLLWYNKDTSALREEPIPVQWIEDAIVYWEELNDYVDSIDVDENNWDKLKPGTYGIPMENWECRYCGFKDIHCKGV